MTSTGWSRRSKNISKPVEMSKPTAEPDEFASAMQQLSAEAKKTPITPAKPTHAGGLVVQEQQSLEERIDNLEATLSKKMEEMVTTISRTRNREVSVQFQKVEEQLASIRNTESVNQRLFDSLHDELLKYRDNFVHDSLQKPFIHDLVHLFDDLSALASQLQSTNEQAKKPA